MSTDIIQYVKNRITECCAENGVEPGSLLLYAEYGIHPGDFLLAVLRDELVESVARADDRNQKRIVQWARVMYSAMPIDSRGSRDKVTRWIKQGGLAGKVKAAEVKANAIIEVVP